MVLFPCHCGLWICQGIGHKLSVKMDLVEMLKVVKQKWCWISIADMMLIRLERYITNIASLDWWLATIGNNRIPWSVNLKNIRKHRSWWFSKKIASLTIIKFETIKIHDKPFQTLDKTMQPPETLNKHQTTLDNHKYFNTKNREKTKHWKTSSMMVKSK